jgi:hypothetical protein
VPPEAKSEIISGFDYLRGMPRFLLLIALALDGGAAPATTLTSFAQAWGQNQLKAEAKWFGVPVRFLTRAGNVSRDEKGGARMIVGAADASMTVVMLSCAIGREDALAIETDQLIFVDGRIGKPIDGGFGKGWMLDDCRVTLKPSPAEIKAACVGAPARAVECRQRSP